MAGWAILLGGCGGLPPLTEDARINVKVESPEPMGFYTRTYGPHVPTPATSSSAPASDAPPGWSPAEKICDVPCAAPVTIGPSRVFWAGDEQGGVTVDLPLASQVIVTIDVGNRPAATVGGILTIASGLSLMTGALLFLAPTEGPAEESTSFLVGVAFGGTGLVTGAIGLPLLAAFTMKADARPAIGPK